MSPSRGVILVDTSVWIDHLNRADAQLIALLEAGGVASHPMVVAELALGSIRNRAEVLDALGGLPGAERASDAELAAFIEARRPWSKGLSLVDAHLLASVLLAPGDRLWTRDKRLAAAAAELDVAWRPSA